MRVGLLAERGRHSEQPVAMSKRKSTDTSSDESGEGRKFRRATSPTGTSAGDQEEKEAHMGGGEETGLLSEEQIREMNELQEKLKAKLALDQAARGEPDESVIGPDAALELQLELLGYGAEDLRRVAERDILRGNKSKRVKKILAYSVRCGKDPMRFEGTPLAEFGNLDAREQIAVISFLSGPHESCALLRALDGTRTVKLETVRAGVAMIALSLCKHFPDISNPFMRRAGLRMNEDPWHSHCADTDGLCFLFDYPHQFPTAFRSTNGYRTACVMEKVRDELTKELLEWSEDDEDCEGQVTRAE